MTRSHGDSDEHETEWEGVWWLPDSPNDRAPGTLIDTGAGIELVLHGADLEPPVKGGPYSGPIRIKEPRWEVTPVVHGRLRDRRSVTLLNASGTHIRGLFVEPETMVYRIELALLGGHVAQDEFAEMRVEFDWLDAWLDPDPIQDPTRLRDTSLIREKTTEISRFAVNTTQVVLKTGVVGTSSEASIHLDRWSAMAVELDEPQDWKHLVQMWVSPIQDLLTVSLGRSVQITWLHFRPPGGTEYDQALEARFHIVQPGTPRRDRRLSKHQAILGSVMK